MRQFIRSVSRPTSAACAKFYTLLCFGLLLVISVDSSHAFNLIGSSWNAGRTTFLVNFPSSDPSPDANKFQNAFIEAMDSWSDNSTFIFDLNGSQAEDPCGPAGSTPKNGVRFTNDVCGDAYGASTLAVTLTSFNASGTIRTGIVFNNAFNWDVFSGFRSGKTDFRRVAVHELGHALGLDHDAGAVAIMRPSISSIEVPQTDDINGVAALYDSDSDGVGNASDNCVTIGNPTQSNLDGDAKGDVCDDDIDGDGVFNAATTDQAFSVNSIASSGFLFGDGTSQSSVFAQTLTVGIGGRLEAVEIPVFCSSGNLQVSIRNINGQNPGTTVLDSRTIAAGFRADSRGFVSVSLGAAVLNSGQQIAIVADSNGRCFWRTALSGSYSAGSARLSNDGSNWFSFNQVGDFPFATRVTPNTLDNCPSNPNPDQADGDNDGIGDVCDSTSGDNDNDLIPNANDNCPNISNADQANFDSDAFGDVCDADIDNDGALNPVDSNDRNVSICSDNDNDQCNDCSSGVFNVANDGLDTDGNGVCNIGDADDDGDGVSDGIDNCQLISNGTQTNFDNDAFGDACDADIDNDGVLNALDSNDRNRFVCSDQDSDSCNDCSSGAFNVAADGVDTDNNGICNAGDADDDGDTVPDVNDNCPLTVNTNQANFDRDAEGDICDDDIDNDGVLNGLDSDSRNRNVCSDSDNDQCDDCSRGSFNVNNDGPDADGNGICNVSDPDDDGDGVTDANDNCQIVANEDQLDANEDGIGDACEDIDVCIPVLAKNGRAALICL